MFLSLLQNPVVIIIITICFLIGFMAYLEESQVFKNFWKFGPVLDPNGQYYKYMTFTLNNWTKVISVYFIIFLTAFVNTLYKTVYKSKWKPNVESKDYSIISKMSTILAICVNPIMELLSYIVNFYAVAVFQFQYLLPMFLGAFCAEIPYLAHFLARKS